jgi:hypothetical protein
LKITIFWAFLSKVGSFFSVPTLSSKVCALKSLFFFFLWSFPFPFLSFHFSFLTSSHHWFCWANPHLGYVLSINTNLCNKNYTWLIDWLMYDIYLNSWSWANRVNRDAMVIGQYVNTIVGQGYIWLVGTLRGIANDT